MPKPDAIRLRHMQEPPPPAQTMATGRTRADLFENQMFAVALIRCLEILGEAASEAQ